MNAFVNIVEEDTLSLPENIDLKRRKEKDSFVLENVLEELLAVYENLISNYLY